MFIFLLRQRASRGKDTVVMVKPFGDFTEIILCFSTDVITTAQAAH